MEGDFKVKKDDRNKSKQRNVWRNKREFQARTPRTKPVQVQSPQPRSIIDVADSSDDYFQRTVESNWDKYNESECSENEQMHAADFEMLQNNKTPVGNHFILSSEKSWDAEDEIFDKTVTYFNLNLSLLNAGLKTIPFYKRLDLDTSYFPKKRVLEMDKEAEMAEIKYQDILKECERVLQEKTTIGSAISSAKSSKSKSKSSTPKQGAPASDVPSNVKEEEKDEELDELLNMNGTGSVKVEQEEGQSEEVKQAESDAAGGVEQNTEDNATQGNKEDLQEWLDGILDDN